MLEAADAAEEAEEAERRMTKRVAELESEVRRADAAAKKAEARAERLAKKLNETIDKKEKTTKRKKAEKKNKAAAADGALAEGSGNDFADEFLDTSVDIVALPALSKMRKQELVDELAARGLDVSGTVPVLRARLREARAAAE